MTLTLGKSRRASGAIETKAGAHTGQLIPPDFERDLRGTARHNRDASATAFPQAMGQHNSNTASFY